MKKLTAFTTKFNPAKVKVNKVPNPFKIKKYSKRCVKSVKVLVVLIIIVSAIVAAILLITGDDSSSSNETVATSSTYNNLGSVSVSRRRSILSGTTGSFDTSTIDSAVLTFFNEYGAKSLVFSWIKSATTNTYTQSADVTFDLSVATSLTDDEVTSNGNTFLNNIKSEFVKRTAAGTLLNIASPSGGSYSPTTQLADLSVSFTQRRGGNSITTTTVATTTTTTAATTTTTTAATATTVSTAVTTTNSGTATIEMATSGNTNANSGSTGSI